MAKILAIKLKPKNTILKNHDLEEGGKVHAFFTATCALHMDKYVPYRGGDLASTVVENGNITDNVSATTITYNQNYAVYQYNGERQDGSHKINEANRTRSYHPLATSYWDSVMMSIEKDEIAKEVQEYYDNLGGQK